ncbi:MAG: PDDEXK nuclease domain-containing protein, partial [Chitinophagaceae bacterium]
KIILEKQQEKDWGQSVVEKLAIDLQKRFRGYKGFSARNLWDMRRFYEAYKDHSKLRQLVAEIPWGHNLLLLNKVLNPAESRYYAEATIQMGWSRKVLLNQIKAKAYNKHKVLPRQHNFKRALPAHMLRQADEMLKSTYNLDFLGITQPVHERELETKLIEKLKNFILELGYGFSFVGNQYRLVLKRKDYFVDLLFFHRKLRCLVAIDLKMGSFEPEFAGKMNFYLNLLDDKIRMEDENPSIGIILCADKDSVEVDYALKGIDKPIAVAEYEFKKSIPKKLQKQLPTVQELQMVIRSEMTKRK